MRLQGHAMLPKGIDLLYVMTIHCRQGRLSVAPGWEVGQQATFRTRG